MTTLCNKKVTRTQTISNATGYSMYTWAIACIRGKHFQQKHPQAWQSRATHAKTVLRWSVFRHRSRHFYDDFVIFVIDVQVWCDFYDEPYFVIKLKLWRIWLLQWQNLFVIEVDISSSVYGAHTEGEDVCAGTWIGPYADRCLNILASGWSLSVRLRSNPWLFLNYTKDDIRLPSRGMPRFVLWIFCPTSCNRFESPSIPDSEKLD
jgi:hypothetical protein